MVDHKDEAPAEGLEVMAAPGHRCLSEVLQPEGSAEGWREVEQERDNTTRYSQRKGVCIKDYATFDMSYISRLSTQELAPCRTVSSAYFRRLLLNDITVLSEVLQIHVYAVLVGQLLK